MTWLQAVRLTAGLFIAAGLVGLVYASLRRADHQFTPVGVAIPAIAGLVVGAVMLALGERFDRRLFFPLGPAAIVLITVGQYFAGPAPIGVVLYVWVAIFSFYVHTRRHAAFNVALIAVAYAVLLGVREGNASPGALWLYIMSTVVVSAAAASWPIEQINRLAVAERTARAEAEKSAAEVAQMNTTLEARVSAQLEELERLSRLRRFLAPQVADVLLSVGEDGALAPHRREIAVLFCDLRGFTAFAADAEPEEVLSVIDEYYEVVGQAVHKFQATVGAFAGDGVMAYFNDPLPCDDAAGRAVDMASTVRDDVLRLSDAWRAAGRDLSLGVGIALGYASLGVVGFDERREYTPLGRVVNLASRLCDEAKPGQILVDLRVQNAVGDRYPSEDIGLLSLKGFPRPVPAFSVAGLPTSR